MDKQIADKLITEYLPKIYGFAVKKSFSYGEAEELCADIVSQVYSSLRKAKEIKNIEGYIWQVSQHAYAKFLSCKKRNEGIPIDGMALPFYDDHTSLETQEELALLRREIAYLTKTRRQIVFWFYYENRSIDWIAKELELSQGTVKWHLNKARNDLKEGFSMKRKMGTLGLSPYIAEGFGHNGCPGKNGGPEYYLSDKLCLNIVYSVYFESKTATQISEELGVSPVFLEDKIAFLEENGYLVRLKGDKFTTYVSFEPLSFSKEQKDLKLTAQQEVAQILVERYVPLVRKAFENVTDIYIPSGNRELMEAAVIFLAIIHKCPLTIEKDLSPYYLKPTDGGEYIGYIYSEQTCTDPDYVSPVKFPPYGVCGEMTRCSEKYPCVVAKAWDSRFCSRKGYWPNNLSTDYEYLYEWMSGMLEDTPANAEKIARLREKEFITQEGKVNIMVVKEPIEKFFDRLPPLDQKIKAQFYDFALEQAMLEAKKYPSQMQDLVVYNEVFGFLCSTVGMMVLDIFYENGTFKPLSEQDKVSANLLMFCDRLPE